MKTPIIFILLGLLGIASAQHVHHEHATPQERSSKVLAKLEKEITFSETQKTEMNTIFTNFYTDLSAAKKSGDKGKIKTLVSEKDKKIASLLSKDDYQKYESAMKSMHHHKHKHGHHHKRKHKKCNKDCKNHK